jgi:hypothetical protein
MSLLAYSISSHTGVRLAELGFLLGAVAGASFALGAITPISRIWNLLAGIALGAGSVLLIVATRWGHFR